MAGLNVEESVIMTTEGREVRERRLRIGATIEQLAAEAEVSPDTLGDFEAGKRRPRDLTISKVVTALERIEEEAGLDAPPLQRDHTVTFDVSAEGGFHVVVSGPMVDADELRRQVTEIIREIRRDPQG